MLTTHLANYNPIALRPWRVLRLEWGSSSRGMTPLHVCLREKEGGVESKATRKADIRKEADPMRCTMLVLFLGIEHNFSSSNFSGTEGKSRQIYPAKKFGFPGFQRTYRTFWSPTPLHVEDPHPTRRYPDQKVWVWVPSFSLVPF